MALMLNIPFTEKKGTFEGRERLLLICKDPRKNTEGYPDPTAYHGLKKIIREENEIEKLNSKIILLFRLIADLAGFSIIGRVTLKHNKTGRVFK